MLTAPATPRARPNARARLLAGLAAAAWLGVGTVAWGQSTIERPGDHVPYSVELEPHLAFGVSDPPGAGTQSGFGAGVQASFELAHNGFVGSINDSVAIGVGADFLHYSGDAAPLAGACRRFVPGPAGTNVCVEVTQTGGRSNYMFLPVVLQWNFWLSPRWSAFVEPGLSLYWLDYGTLGASPAFFFGGRAHVTDRVTITLRIGYPTFTLGASFLL
jgi:hypothetical protein